MNKNSYFSNFARQLTGRAVTAMVLVAGMTGCATNSQYDLADCGAIYNGPKCPTTQIGGGAQSVVENMQTSGPVGLYPSAPAPAAALYAPQFPVYIDPNPPNYIIFSGSVRGRHSYHSWSGRNSGGVADFDF